MTQEKHYIISKYKSKPRYFYHPSPFQSSIYSLMKDRGYTVIGEIFLEDNERVKNAKKMVNDYLSKTNADENWYYMYHINYPKRLFDEKYIAVFGQPLMIDEKTI